MEKTCPRCGARYPATARYCDQDGAVLSEATTRSVSVPTAPSLSTSPSRTPSTPRRGRWIALALALLLVLGAGIAAPRLLERYLRVRIGVSIEEVSYPSAALSDAPDSLPGLLDRITGVVGALAGNGQIDVRLRLRNDTPLRVSLVSATYDIEVDRTAAASGVWKPEGEPLLFAPGDEITPEISVRPEPEAALAISRGLLRGRRPELRVRGHLTVGALWTTFTFPYEVEHLRVDLRSSDPPLEPAAPALEGLEDGPRLVV
jgi:hypothetical protein